MVWDDNAARAIGNAEELQLASLSADGTLSNYTTMWVVRADGDIYVRSAGGPDRPWYQRAVAHGAGRIRASGVEYNVTFDEASTHPHAAIDSAYHSKYDRYGQNIVGHVVGPQAKAVTIRLETRPEVHRMPNERRASESTSKGSDR